MAKDQSGSLSVRRPGVVPNLALLRLLGFSIWLFNFMNDIEVRHEIVESTKDRLRLRLHDGFIVVCAREFVDGFHGIPKREYDEFDPPVNRAAQQVGAAMALDLSQFGENGSRRMSNVFVCSFGGGLSLPHAQDHDAFSGLIGVEACSPATVVHSRTYHRFTKPLVTSGSFFAKFSATSGESPLNNNTAPSTGFASAPPSKSSPRSLAFQAFSRC